MSKVHVFAVGQHVEEIERERVGNELVVCSLLSHLLWVLVRRESRRCMPRPRREIHRDCCVASSREMCIQRAKLGSFVTFEIEVT